MTSDVRIGLRALRSLAADVLERSGLETESAHRVSEVLTEADIRGVDTHGCVMMLPKYVEWLATGQANPRPRPSLIRSSPSTAVYDGGGGLGQGVLPGLMEVAVEKASDTGVGIVTVGGARHSGMLASYAMIPLDRDMIGVCAATGNPRVFPTNGTRAIFGTNPLAIAIPADFEFPWVFDASMSVVAHNKIVQKREAEACIPAGWCADEFGNPIGESTPATLDHEMRMLPLGGTPANGSHKGYALAAMIDILCGVLAGGTFAANQAYGDISHMVAAINVSSFTDTTKFRREVGSLMELLTSMDPAPGTERVLVPNQIEHETAADRTMNGIPINSVRRRALESMCGQLDIDFSAYTECAIR